jgi:excisionase family DNA binding protein
MSLLTTREVAERLGVTMKRVQAMIRDDRLPAEKMGRDYVVREADLKLVENRKPGRPPNAQTNGAAKAPAETTAKLNKAFREATEVDQEASKVTMAEKAVLRSAAPKQVSKKKASKK